MLQAYILRIAIAKSDQVLTGTNFVPVLKRMITHDQNNHLNVTRSEVHELISFVFENYCSSNSQLLLFEFVLFSQKSK